MLAVMEELLDSWPGTLLMVTHDRYLMERVTDDQYALIDGKVRHLPGGVDEYLGLLDRRDAARTASAAGVVARGANGGVPSSGAAASASDGLSQSELRALRKELASTERRMATLRDKVAASQEAMHQAEPSDYVRLGELQAQTDELQAQLGELEDRWLELSETLS